MGVQGLGFVRERVLIEVTGIIWVYMYIYIYRLIYVHMYIQVIHTGHIRDI